MMGLLCIKALQVETLVGIYFWEQTQKQKLILNIECEIDVDKAALTDRIEDALNYQKVAEEITKLLQENHFQLIESVAKFVTDYLKNTHQITKGRIKLIKPTALLQAESVSITVEW